jgi:hypothetical protein
MFLVSGRFVHQLDELIVASAWWDPEFRLLKAHGDS